MNLLFQVRPDDDEVFFIETQQTLFILLCPGCINILNPTVGCAFRALYICKVHNSEMNLFSYEVFSHLLEGCGPSVVVIITAYYKQKHPPLHTFETEFTFLCIYNSYAG